MTVAQQVAHAAQTLDWFVEGAARPEGFDLNFHEHARALETGDFAGGSAPDARKRLLQRDYVSPLAHS